MSNVEAPQILDDAGIAGHLQYELQECTTRLSSLLHSGNSRKILFSNIAYSARDAQSGKIEDKIFLACVKFVGKHFLTQDEISQASEIGIGLFNKFRQLEEINSRH